MSPSRPVQTHLVCLSWYKMPRVLPGSSSRRDPQNCVRRLPGPSLGVCSPMTLCGGELEGLTLSFFQSGKHRSPLTGSTAPSEAAVPKTALVFSAGRGAGGRWSPAQAWKSLSPDLPKSETHGALMAVYAVIRKADLEAGGLWNWEIQPSVSLRVFRSLRKMRSGLDVIGTLCLFKKPVVSFLGEPLGLTGE